METGKNSLHLLFSELLSYDEALFLFGRNLPQNTSISPKIAVHTVMVTTSGLTHNAYTGEIQNEVDLNKESQHPKR